MSAIDVKDDFGNEQFFKSDIILENNNVLLRPLHSQDLESLVAISFSDRLWEYGRRVKNREDVEQYIQICLSWRDQKRNYPFVIIDKHTHKIAGITQFGAVDFSQKRIEIGWTWLGEAWQGTGINYFVKHLMLKYCFDKGLRRVQFMVDFENQRSASSLKKLGATCEGLLRNYSIQSYGPSKGFYVFSIIDDEWEAIDKSLIQTYDIRSISCV